MEADYTDDNVVEDVWSNWICPSCKTWHQLEDYVELKENEMEKKMTPEEMLQQIKILNNQLDVINSHLTQVNNNLSGIKKPSPDRPFPTVQVLVSLIGAALLLSIIMS